MDYGALPPEVNSGRMYAGAGSGSMLAAASSWDGLAAQLHSTATSYGSVISGLTSGWSGPSSASMAAAAAPYMAWMSATATQAEQAATQARAAASAYQSAYTATVHPAAIATNRSQLEALVATNTFGQNTTAIAATEAQYGEMWAQDAAAMYGYAGASAAASTVTPFSSPSQTTNPAGTAAQGTAVARAAGTAAGTNAQTIMSAAPTALHSLAAPLAAAAPASPLSALTNLLSTLNSSPLATVFANIELIPKAILPANDVLISIIMGLVIGARGLGDVVVAAGSSPATGALAAGLGTTGTLASAGSTGLAGAGSAVSASMGSAGLAGGLSVPTSWATATPAIRLAATVLQSTGPSATPAVTAASSGSLFGQMAVASLAGGALGGAVPRVISGPLARAGRPTADKDGKTPDEDSKTPDKLKRVLAELSAKPESVQHWHTDEAQLESLLARLSKKPGIHAVHTTRGDKSKPTPPKPLSR